MTPGPSLIQRRMALNRMRLTGIWLVSAGTALAVLTGILTLYSPDPFGWYRPLVCSVGVIIGIRRLSKYRDERAIFEAENGADAGKQAPVA